jgi:hypothetical protein
VRFPSRGLRPVQVVFLSFVFTKENLMHAATFGGARTPDTAIAESKQVKSRASLFARFMNGLKESRLQEARRVIERHSHLMAPDNLRDDGAASEGRIDETLSDRT